MAERPAFTRDFINLALPEHGGAIVSASDDFFAPAKRMLASSEPVFIPDKFDQHGKWMDGWESRRKRVSGHDQCTLRICAGVIHGIEIDTSHFTGNFPPATSLEACSVAIEPDEDTVWTELIEKSDLLGDNHHFFDIVDEHCWTHLRLHIYPDGGIARLRVYGEPKLAGDQAARDRWIDLASADAGGQALECNNMHFGHMSNLLSARPVANMGDGWETRRRRKPGNDWVILKLGSVGQIFRVEVDTAFFRGNYPARCSLKGTCSDPGEDISSGSEGWKEILPAVALGPDQLHVFEHQLNEMSAVSHVRFDIYPDGGVARLRLLGVPDNSGEAL